MNVNLHDEDRRAIDLLLDRQAAAGSVQQAFSMETAFASHGTPVSPERLAGVDQVLSLLNLLPDEEPPADLLERTLARCEQSTGSAGATVTRVLGLDSMSHA